MDITTTQLWEMFKHVRTWLTNLERASDERKKESINALRAVIKAVRKTESYLRRLDKEGQDHTMEDELSTLWTDLSYQLTDLGLDKLAAKCFLKGKYWANRENYSETKFHDKSVISLQMIEHLASKHLRHIKKT